MIKRKNILVVAAVVAAVISGAATMPYQQQQQEYKAKNLKVLPKNISHEDLDKIMDEYKVALGVRCGFCHAPRKDDPKKLDFASDEKPAKNIARDMMRMTMKINTKYFKDHKGKNGESMVAVTCITCHNGDEHPATTK